MTNTTPSHTFENPNAGKRIYTLIPEECAARAKKRMNRRDAT
jgi:hypothetical protein